ncbi:MAG: hypothetical protein U0414_41975 [Polyangiaceae bacterium]
MESDTERVNERVDVVLRVLQSWRARRAPTSAESAPLADAASALSSFRDRARGDGWIPAFDATLAALRAAAEHLGAPERAELARTADSLAELEPSVVRLASLQSAASASRAAAPTRASAFLVPSGETPSLHPDDRDARGALDRDRHATDQLARSARDALEEVAAMSMLRRPEDDMPWTSASSFERRLLFALDACAAYRRGRARVDVEDLALRIARDFPVLDQGKWFAALFLLACTDGDHAASRLRQAILELPAGAAPAAIDALALGSNPRCGRVALTLLEEDDRPFALEIGLTAARRLALPELASADGAIAALLDHPSDRIASLAARCLGRADAGQAAPLILPLLDRAGASVEAAFVLGMRGAEAGPQHLRRCLARGAADRATPAEQELASAAARALAHFGKARDEEALVAAARTHDDVIESLADHGSPALVAPLTSILEAPTRPRGAEAAARALERITGVPLPEPTPERPDGIDVGAFSARVRAFVPPPLAERLRHGARLDRGVALAELADPNAPMRDRSRAARGLAVLLGRPLDVDHHGWVATQGKGLRELGASTHVQGGDR